MKQKFNLEDMYMLAAKVVDDIAANRMNGDWNLKMTPKMITDDFIENGYPKYNYTPAASPVPENENQTFKVVCNLGEMDYYTDNREEAYNKYQQYISDYGDGIRLYEAIKPADPMEAFEWGLIDAYDIDE